MEHILVNGSKVQPRLAILKPISSAISIGTGGPFGAEGPIILTGGAVGSIVGQLFHLTPAQRRSLLVAGAAAGMSAVFGTPVAATLFGVELLAFLSGWRRGTCPDPSPAGGGARHCSVSPAPPDPVGADGSRCDIPLPTSRMAGTALQLPLHSNPDQGFGRATAAALARAVAAAPGILRRRVGLRSRPGRVCRRVRQGRSPAGRSSTTDAYRGVLS